MSPLLQGILIGLTLAMLVGPLVFTLIQTSVEQGFRAGLMVGTGIWSSDLLFATLSWFGLRRMEALMHWAPFPIVVGIAGGILLMAFGTLLLWQKTDLHRLRRRKAVRHSTVLHLWSQGFLINSLNPFTFFFWMGVPTAFVLRQGWTGSSVLAFYGGILGTLVVTDAAKAGLAKLVRRWLRPRIIIGMRRTIGVVLIIFGIALLGRTLFMHDQLVPAF